ncbi:MAG: HXXEE domain-containing protein, partial [Streptococcus sp.]
EFFLFSLVGSGIVVINLLFALWLGKKYSTWLAHNH